VKAQSLVRRGDAIARPAYLRGDGRVPIDRLNAHDLRRPPRHDYGSAEPRRVSASGSPLTRASMPRRCAATWWNSSSVTRREELDVKLTLHPDDPPRPLFGLPRVASRRRITRVCSMPCLHRPTAFAFARQSRRVAAERSRRHRQGLRAAHSFRASALDAARRGCHSFFEADHLDGDFDMIAVLQACWPKTTSVRKTANPLSTRPWPSHDRRPRQANQTPAIPP